MKPIFSTDPIIEFNYMGSRCNARLLGSKIKNYSTSIDLHDKESFDAAIEECKVILHVLNMLEDEKVLVRNCKNLASLCKAAKDSGNETLDRVLRSDRIVIHNM